MADAERKGDLEVRIVDADSQVSAKVDGSGNLYTVVGTPAAIYSIALLYEKTESPVGANMWQDVIVYTVPSGYNWYNISLQVNSTNAGDIARAIFRENFGSIDLATGTYTDTGNTFPEPTFGSSMTVYCNTATGSGNNVDLTITYVNQDGVGGRTATVTIPKSSLAGARFVVPLQAGDYGVRDVTNVTRTPSSTGILTIEGNNTTMYVVASSANTLFTASRAPQSSIVYGGDTIVLQYWSSGGTRARRVCLEGVLIEA